MPKKRKNFAIMDSQGKIYFESDDEMEILDFLNECTYYSKAHYWRGKKMLRVSADAVCFALLALRY